MQYIFQYLNPMKIDIVYSIYGYNVYKTTYKLEYDLFRYLIEKIL